MRCSAMRGRYVKPSIKYKMALTGNGNRLWPELLMRNEYGQLYMVIVRSEKK